MKSYGTIYKITNLVNNKVYIGQTSQKNFNERYSAKGKGIERVYWYHVYRKRYGDLRNTHLLRSIEKYGFDKFVVDEIFDVAYDEKELNEKEMYWIKYYNSNDPNYGYNGTIGGENGAKGTYQSYIKDFRMKRITPIIILESGEVFASRKELYTIANKNLKLNEVKQLQKEFKNETHVFKRKYDYSQLKEYTSYVIKCPPYNADMKHSANLYEVPIINTITKEMFFNLKLAREKYGKHILKECKENLITRDVNSEWMYLVEYLAHEKSGDFNK